MTEYLHYIGYGLVTIGVIFDFFGALALVRLPDVYNRILGATKCVTMGTSSIMLGIFVINGFNVLGIKALLCIFFLMLTSPVSGQVLSRAAHIAGVKTWDKTVCDHYDDDRKSGKIK